MKWAITGPSSPLSISASFTWETRAPTPQPLSRRGGRPPPCANPASRCPPTKIRTLHRWGGSNCQRTWEAQASQLLHSNPASSPPPQPSQLPRSSLVSSNRPPPSSPPPQPSRRPHQSRMSLRRRSRTKLSHGLGFPPFFPVKREIFQAADSKQN